MVRSVETIRKELRALDEATATLAEEFDRLYNGYLVALGRALRQQVVIAAYHLCTQVYPDAFLDLSVSQREHLQQNLRRLSREGQQHLQKLMEEPESEPQEFENLSTEQQERISRLTAALEAIPTDDEEDQDQEEDSANTAPSSFPTDDTEGNQPPSTPRVQFIAVDNSVSDDADAAFEAEAPIQEEAPQETETDATSEGADQEETDQPPEATSDQATSKQKMDPRSLIQSVIMAAMADDMQETLHGRPFTGENMTPTLLAKHHLILEQRIRQVLHRLSKQANHHLKQADVIPDLPEAVLDAAAEAETGPEKGRSMPNLLNVLVEMSSDMESESSQDADDQDDPSEEAPSFEEDSAADEDTIQGMMTHLAAINLRLSDLEFADVQSSMGRSKLRAALGKLRKLGKQYQRIQRELAIAEAEQAWRAVWYDDSSD